VAWADEPPLEGWKDIARYLRRSKRTVQRWENKGLPVQRQEVLGIIAYRSELDLWVKRLKDSGLTGQDVEASNRANDVRREGPAEASADLRAAGSSGAPKESWSQDALNGERRAVLWLRRRWFRACSTAVLASAAYAVVEDAYGVAMILLWVGAAFVVLGYMRVSDGPVARAAVAFYLVSTMAYTTTASTMSDLMATMINITKLPPAPAFLFVLGLKFVPLYVLVLAYWAISGYRVSLEPPVRGFVSKSYLALGLLVLCTEFLLLERLSGDNRVWQAGVPGRWTILIGSAVVLAGNLAVWIAGLSCFAGAATLDYRRLFTICAVIYLPVAVGAFFVEAEHNRINRYYLDIRWPEPYIVSNPDAVREATVSARGELTVKIGPDLEALLNDPAFNTALRHGKFYKQHLDESFQLARRAVVFAYRAKPSSNRARNEFIAIRFPKDLADALRFHLAGE
jgi:hypothetical protein